MPGFLGSAPFVTKVASMAVDDDARAYGPARVAVTPDGAPGPRRQTFGAITGVGLYRIALNHN